MTRLVTCESVSAGHPDKVCDRISDSILDLYLSHDMHARVAVETLATHNKVVICGEVRSKITIDSEQIINTVRNTIKNIGYDQEGFHWNNVDITLLLHEQSPDIAMGVDAKSMAGEGAGDQGTMIGYATNETANYMPAPITYAHQLLSNLYNIARSNPEGSLGIDMKAQITMLYDKHDRPQSIDNMVVSIQHKEGVSASTLKKITLEQLEKIVPSHMMCKSDKIYINPTGKFVKGGPGYDTGLTGRKIVVDTYGAVVPHGGGAFSGKDPTKVDRSAAYAMRYIAKNIVASGLARKCVTDISYAIGMPEPLAMNVTSLNTSSYSDAELLEIAYGIMDYTPRAIIEHLDLLRPIYATTTSYGHFGRDPSQEQAGHFSWENIIEYDISKSIQTKALKA